MPEEQRRILHGALLTLVETVNRAEPDKTPAAAPAEIETLE
jgi:hypothetical protein